MQYRGRCDGGTVFAELLQRHYDIFVAAKAEVILLGKSGFVAPLAPCCGANIRLIASGFCLGFLSLALDREQIQAWKPM
jgi:hypothetical protein